MIVAKPIFLDTGFAIALLSPRDQYHSAARRLAAIQFIRALRADPNVEIVATDTVLWQDAFDLFGARTDKEWSLTDCLSFVLMSRRDINNALAADEHFRQAGFVPLLLAE